MLWTQGELARLEAAALELASLSRAAPAREAAESAAAARMHDLAHLVAQAQLLLDAEGALDRAGLRACLAECARAFDSAEFAQEPSSGAPTTTRIAELLERETQRALGARRGAESVRVLAQVDCGLETELDPHVLGRLVRNLVLNAIEASAEGGIVRVRAWSSDAVLRLEVRDEGRGLDAKRRARLFGAHGIEARGRGLGTESVRLCALRLGARVAVEGAPGRGLVVTASWDVPRNRAAVALLVDVPATRARIGERLRREGATVLEHEAGRALLRAGLTESVSRWVVGRGAPILATIEGRRLRGRPFEVASLADAHLD
ncbi:MAG: ATP-binding protein [Planctomycetes bacterium]|nr:ATP-binding protein [Planctomycetota bacterium]